MLQYWSLEDFFRGVEIWKWHFEISMWLFICKEIIQLIENIAFKQQYLLKLFLLLLFFGFCKSIFMWPKVVFFYTNQILGFGLTTLQYLI